MRRKLKWKILAIAISLVLVLSFAQLGHVEAQSLKKRNPAIPPLTISKGEPCKIDGMWGENEYRDALVIKESRLTITQTTQLLVFAMKYYGDIAKPETVKICMIWDALFITQPQHQDAVNIDFDVDFDYHNETHRPGILMPHDLDIRLQVERPANSSLIDLGAKSSWLGWATQNKIKIHSPYGIKWEWSHSISPNEKTKKHLIAEAELDFLLINPKQKPKVYWHTWIGNVDTQEGISVTSSSFRSPWLWSPLTLKGWKTVTFRESSNIPGLIPSNQRDLEIGQSVTVKYPRVIQSNDTRYVLLGISVNNAWTPVGGRGTDSQIEIPLSVTSDTTVIANYKVQYFVKVESKLGTPKGEGWYDAKTPAVISIDATVPKDGIWGVIGSKYIFAKWEKIADGQSKEMLDYPRLSFVVEEPAKLVAIWNEDNSATTFASIAIVALVIASVAIFYKTKRNNGKT